MNKGREAVKLVIQECVTGNMLYLYRKKTTDQKVFPQY